MATDEYLGAQAQGRISALIQNGDWRGVLPQTTNNAAATANQIRARPSNPASCRTGIYAPVDTSGEMVTPSVADPFGLPSPL